LAAFGKVAYLAALSLGTIICAGFMHWTAVGYIAGISLIVCCLRIAEMQIETLKDHVEKLEKRMDDLGARTK